jgi:hypothetical protein
MLESVKDTDQGEDPVGGLYPNWAMGGKTCTAVGVGTGTVGVGVVTGVEIAVGAAVGVAAGDPAHPATIIEKIIKPKNGMAFLILPVIIILKTITPHRSAFDIRHMGGWAQGNPRRPSIIDSL